MKEILSAALTLGTIIVASAPLHAQNDPTIVGEHMDGRPVHVASLVRQASDNTITMMKRRAKPASDNGQLYMMQGSRSLFETNF
jgi:hypothetical protein